MNSSPDYSAGIFFIPKGKGLPFHDHLNMLVFSKVLYGELHVTSLNVNQKDENQKGNDIKVLKKTELELKKNDVAILSPSHGNIHQVIASQDAAFIDILIPNYEYNDCAGTCVYYKMFEKDNNTYLNKI